MVGKFTPTWHPSRSGESTPSLAPIIPTSITMRLYSRMGFTLFVRLSVYCPLLARNSRTNKAINGNSLHPRHWPGEQRWIICYVIGDSKPVSVAPLCENMTFPQNRKYITYCIVVRYTWSSQYFVTLPETKWKVKKRKSDVQVGSASERKSNVKVTRSACLIPRKSSTYTDGIAPHRLQTW